MMTALAYAALDCRTLILRGEHAPLSTGLVVDALQAGPVDILATI